MYKSLVAFAFAALLSGCAGTTQGTASAAEECKIIAQDNTDSHIKVRQECDSAAGRNSAPAQPQNATVD